MKKEYIYPSVSVYQLRYYGEPVMAAVSNPTAANDDIGDPTLDPNGEQDHRTDQPIVPGTGDALTKPAGKLDW